MKFLDKQDLIQTQKPVWLKVEIGKRAFFRCRPRSPKVVAGATYRWGNRDDNSNQDFYIKTNERVWISSRGDLVFGTFKQEDANLINAKGIRCFIEQKTSDGSVHEVMSRVFKVTLKSKYNRPLQTLLKFHVSPFL